MSYAKVSTYLAEKTMILDWVRIHETAFWWIGSLSMATFLGTLIIIPILVVRIPEDYFKHEKQKPDHLYRRYSFIRILVLALKNLLGLIFIIAGLVMLLLPGQGFITILIGIMMLNFPGKFALQLRIVQQPNVLRAINWMRTKADRPALEVPKLSLIKGGNKWK
jgi:archaellum biogenesis protein FlaJ (TadC family)